MTDTILLTPLEAGRISGLGLKAINAAIASGDLRAKLKPPTNRYRLVLRSDLEKYLESLPDA